MGTEWGGQMAVEGVEGRGDRVGGQMAVEGVEGRGDRVEGSDGSGRCRAWGRGEGAQMAVEGVGRGDGVGGSDGSAGCRGAWAGGPQCGSGIPWGGGVGVGKATLDPDNKEPGPGQEAEG